MKKGLVVAAVAALALTMGTQAMAANNSGNEKHGKVELTNSDVSIFTTQMVGGGQWDYGTSTTATQKRCYSDYHHPDNYHSSTAKVGTAVDKDYADAGSWSLAEAYGPKDQTGLAYWDNDAVAAK